MANGIPSISYFNKNKLIIFILIQTIIPLIRSLSLKYPTALTLNNNNIFIIHSLGIDICDSLYRTNEKIIEFGEEISKTDLSKISISKYSSGEFILLIIDTIYIFDGFGQKILEYTFEQSFNGEYFTLSAHKIIQGIDTDEYYFLFGYTDQSSFELNLYYYRLETSSDQIEIISSIMNYDNDIKIQD